jgi:surface polysaccharide O-acyltransferase-like enzyme
MADFTKRQTNFELLKILSALLIVSFHCVYHGGFTYTGTFSASQWLLKEFWLFGQLGVNLFMMISGYFMINSKFQKTKLFKLVFLVYFYHILSCTVAWLSGNLDGNQISDFLSALLFPVTRRTYWYVTVYLMIYLLSPFINRFVKALTQKAFATLLMITFVLWSLLPTLSGWAIGVERDLYYYNRFIWCVVVYLWGAYIRLYSLSVTKNKRSSLLLASVSFLLASLAIPAIMICNALFGLSVEPAYFWHPNTVLTLLTSIGMFGFALHTNGPNWKWIPVLSSTSLGIYLLHDGKLRNFIWQRVFPNAQHQDSPFLILYILFAILAIFLCGIIVDLLRQLLAKGLLKLLPPAKDSRIKKVCSNILTKIYRIFNI